MMLWEEWTKRHLGTKRRVGTRGGREIVGTKWGAKKMKVVRHMMLIYDIIKCEKSKMMSRRSMFCKGSAI
ncbi:hypothetical protein DVH24_015675 [Malus domestica]|uniref:Uncharacterized protein n=1 Tax=Malus domestica TaxID=3750 RepID=A0A498HQA7_MALDO|nr:hypothetical protein DVH24_015675 [Malus domestica]